MILKRYVHGADGEPFFQKRAPTTRPAWIETARFAYPSGGVADEIVVNDAASLVWVVNLGCIEMHAHPIRADDMDRPDELRIDLDPVAGVGFQQVVDVARVVHSILDDVGLVGWPKTSGSRGVHVWVRIQRRWPFTEVRRAALALAREVERRAPSIATSTWQKTERHGVLVDYNQNARDRTTASAYSVRATPDPRVSTPVTWRELDDCEPADFTMATVPKRLQERGDPHARIDEEPLSLDQLLELADAQEPRKPTRLARAQAGSARNARVVVVARSKSKADALAGLERWKAAHADVVGMLAAEDYIVDAMRGRSSAWYRVRINLKSVPPDLRPPPSPPDPDYDPKLE
jgi:DNA ligase D-like protein (predicted polymerase)